ncbi:MAG TPA: DUF3455 domain-containing protein [Candidatus Dormibacteraeota bacterium]|nr:DUF3455 domain-containing protein [Candidatus Dormibacteraeota bacterium]
MNHDYAPKNLTTRRMLLGACATALAVGLTVSLPQPAHAVSHHVTPPPVPDKLKVEEGNTAFLVGHATGTQNYICLPCPNPTTPATQCPDASGFAWLLFTPEATLFTDNDKQVITHFFSPNPDEDGTIRATWQDSRDTSIVWGGKAISATHDTDPDFVAEDAIAWLTLPAAGVQEGPTGGDTLTKTTFIQRLNTSGGLAPSDGCSQLSNVGAKAFRPYTADYFFYSKDHDN